ncbi:EXS family-domain-containing protein [Lanmaoa asiatica]|nr:EXS family-domain-containing protein [Lanmaoa asiatica]
MPHRAIEPQLNSKGFLFPLSTNHLPDQSVWIDPAQRHEVYAVRRNLLHYIGTSRIPRPPSGKKLTCDEFTVLFSCPYPDMVFIPWETCDCFLFHRDYRGLKVQLGIIRAVASQSVDTWSSFGGPDVDYTRYSATNDEEKYDDSKVMTEVYLTQGTTMSTRIASLWASRTEPATNGTKDSSGHGIASSLPSFGAPGQPPLHTLLSNLPAIHTKFFDMLDAELDKVETFYAERAKELYEHAKLLRRQLDELGIHRQMFYESSAHSDARGWAKRAYLSVPPALSSLIPWFRDTKPKEPHQTDGNGILASNPGLVLGRRGVVGTFNLGTQVPERGRLNDHSGSWRKLGVASITAEMDFCTASFPTLNGSSGMSSARLDSLPNLSSSRTKHPLDPHEYQHAKRRLRNAVIEHYRCVGIILNLAGFRKALSKYGKITRNPIPDAYMKEKVEPSAFASGAIVSDMLKEMEHLFATQFEHGDRKKAMDHLRVGSSSKTHHSSVFRSALWLGLALPAIAGGSYLSFQEHTRESLPSWNILLFIYSILVIPVLLALLIGINILVWAQKRISYVFIFSVLLLPYSVRSLTICTELNPRSRIDHHEYFELPSFFLCTLAFAFWFSLAQIGHPMLWPLIWLVLTLAVIFCPFREFMWGRTRWWTIRKIAKLGASGMLEVEFTDVWLGDHFCSLVYSLSNLYFVGCFYTRFSNNLPGSTVQLNSESSLYASFLDNATSPHQAESSVPDSAFRSLLSSAYAPQAQEAWSACGVAQNWGWYYLLGMLPFLVRLVQNVRRYWNSKLFSQLINAGKYGMGMMCYFFYCYWRHQNFPRTGDSYILWCFTTTVYTIYGCAWDVFMDWGMGKPHARYPLLRPELVYKSQISVRFAVSNLCIRFTWLAYIFVDEANFELYTFIIAVLEMLRRVQWNFYRLEHKHLHNTGLHRITREVPLPYSLDAHDIEEEARLRKRMARLS